MCAFDDPKVRRFVMRGEGPVDRLPWGSHYWACKPGLVDTQQLLVVQVDMPPGTAHPFHHHPGREEVLWIIDGKGEQWVEQEKRLVGPGDSVFVPPGTVHGLYNDSGQIIRFLAVLSPAQTNTPLTVDVQYDAPWCSLRSLLQQASW